MQKYVEQSQNFRLWLQNELTTRCKKNPSYSLRSFAKVLDIDPSSLSQILSGKRNYSAKVIKKFCSKLAVSPDVEHGFCLSVQRQINQEEALASYEDNYYQIQTDIFSIISDWYHYAILELTFVNGFKDDPRWIANKLGITVTEAKIAIERLLRFDLLVEKNGQLIKSENFLTNGSEGVTSAALKKLQKHVLEKALKSIDDTPQEEKDITSMTMAIDESKILEAKELIKDFRRKLCGFLEDGKQTKVYNLGIQLFPISKS